MKRTPEYDIRLISVKQFHILSKERVPSITDKPAFILIV